MVSDADSTGHLREVAGLFLKLGIIGFGGPAAHIAMMRDEVVRRRGWLGDQDFLDMVGATNLIPGPNSTEMAIHLGKRRAGWPGLILGGALFILPAMLIVLAVAMAYVRYGTMAQAQWLLYGIKPVIIAIILQALWALGRRAARTPLLVGAGVGALALYLLGVNEVLLVFAGGGVMALVHGGKRLAKRGAAGLALLPLGGLSLGTLPVGAAPYSLLTLFLNFLKIGSVLYGSGYVLLAFLRGDFVDRLGWLTEQQLLDAIAVGQFTPGPVLTTATFVGYVVGGLPAAVLATVGIFLPAFVFVSFLSRILPLVRRSPLAAAALDGVNVVSLALMGGVALQLGRASIVDPFTIVLALVALAVVFRTRVNSVWVVAGGGVLGLGYGWMVGG
ncbi:MAG: chromate efflux transporter [Chloroflexi bacterium]|nr:chromate efflux transporter [Chloroflexota bacterium]